VSLGLASFWGLFVVLLCLIGLCTLVEALIKHASSWAGGEFGS
jgi:hypothetical protein